MCSRFKMTPIPRLHVLTTRRRLANIHFISIKSGVNRLPPDLAQEERRSAESGRKPVAPQRDAGDIAPFILRDRRLDIGHSGCFAVFAYFGQAHRIACGNSALGPAFLEADLGIGRVSTAVGKRIRHGRLGDPLFQNNAARQLERLEKLVGARGHRLLPYRPLSIPTVQRRAAARTCRAGPAGLPARSRRNPW